MSQRIALFGGSFNPPGQHHRDIVLALRQFFDRIIVVPCGLRPDKRTVEGVEAVHRAAMVDLTFGDLDRVEVLNFDLENDTFTTTVDLEARLSHYGELWHVVGLDLIEGGASGKSPIQTSWYQGWAIWNTLRFVVVERDGYNFDVKDCPPQHRRIHPSHSGSSTEIRQRLFDWQPVTGLVRPTVERYIERYGLYRGSLPRHIPSLTLAADIRYTIVCDPHTSAAVKTAEALRHHVAYDPLHPDLIVVLGGDGTMLQAIRQHWHRRLPFFGMNFGTVGFLLNDRVNAFEALQHQGELMVRHAPLLYTESRGIDGQPHQALAFNDAYVQAALGKAAWLEVRVDGESLIPKLVADGALVATPAGSTAYARAMGATPMPIGTKNLLLVGNNVLQPNWKSAELDQSSVIELISVDPTPQPKKRPLYGFVDGEAQGEIARMTIRTSRVAAVELCFLPDDDLRRKLTRSQFPSIKEKT